MDAVETWHHYDGAALALSIAHPTGETEEVRLGRDIRAGETPHAVVAPGAWQQARTLGEFTLVGCAVAPAFEFASFEMAPAGFDPRAPTDPAP